MQTEARVGVVVEGGQRALNSGHASIVDGGARKFVQQQQQQRSLHQQSQIGTVSQLLAGGVAGAVSKTCTAPLARLTILFQVQGMHCNAATLSKASIWHEASRIVNEEGFRAFWKGNMVTIAHRLPYSSVSFYSYERYKNLLQSIPGLESHRENITADLFVRLVGGGLAGITAASATYPLDLVRTRLAAQTSVNYYRGIWHSLRTISSEEGLLGLYKATFPLDLVRRRMQLEGAGGRARVYKTGLFGTFGHIVRTEGLRGLYRGIIPEYYKVVPSVGIVFMTYETMKLLLSEKAADG